MTGAQSKHIKDDARKKIEIVAAVAFAGLVACAIIVILAPFAIPAPNLTIMGNVINRDSRIQQDAIEITFISTNDGKKYTSLINDVGFYQLQLPEGNYNYDVVIKWQDPNGSSDICSAGPLEYHEPHPSILVRDFEC